MKFRKRPVVVDACQWFRKGHAPVWAEDFIKEYDDHFSISTLEGLMHGEPGDWIIRGIKGECYSCKPDIFQQTYESV